MRLHQRPEVRLLALAAIAAGAVFVLRSSHPVTLVPAAPPSTWRGLVGDAHPSVSLSRRMIVVLRTPSVAQRLAGGKLATEADERRWTAEAYAAQQQVLTQLARHGLGLRPDYSFARVLDGFSGKLDPRAVALLSHNSAVAGIYPVRAAFPATISSSAGEAGARALGVGVPGLDGNGVSIALLDTGVDLSQPYLGGRVERGVDIVGGTDSAAAQRNPRDRAEIEQHGTELAGLLVGSNGPGGIEGAAPGATVLPIRIAGWQPARGGDTVYARSDQVIAGLDRAVDPNGDGDAHDAVRIALIGVAEPFAAFADSPEAQAVSGAQALDVLVVTPAGNSGPAGPLYGSIAGPAGSPAALSVGAVDTRPTTSTIRVVLRQGLAVLFDGELPLLDSAPNSEPLDLAVGLPQHDENLTGRAVFVAGGADPAAPVAAAIHAGAAAVFVYGAQPPPGGLGSLGVPVVGVTRSVERAVLSTAGRGFAVSVALGDSRAQPNAALGRVSPFSSRGLAFDGQLAPQLSAPGVGILTSDPGSAGDGEPAFASVSGTSVSAAAVAGVAALLFEERPGLTAADVASLLVGAARGSGATLAIGGTGMLDAGASAIEEIAASVTSVSFGLWTGPHWRAKQVFTLHNVTNRPLTVKLSSDSPVVSVRPAQVSLPAGRTATVTATALLSAPPAEQALTGLIVAAPRGSPKLEIPWTIGAGTPPGSLLGAVTLEPRTFSPSKTQSALMRVVAGRVTVDSGLEVVPASRLDVLLYRANGTFVGVLVRVRDLLPGTYSFAITGRGPRGAPLAKGGYQLRLVAWPTLPGKPSRASVRFRIQ